MVHSHSGPQLRQSKRHNPVTILRTTEAFGLRRRLSLLPFIPFDWLQCGRIYQNTHIEYIPGIPSHRFEYRRSRTLALHSIASTEHPIESFTYESIEQFPYSALVAVRSIWRQRTLHTTRDWKKHLSPQIEIPECTSRWLHLYRRLRLTHNLRTTVQMQFTLPTWNSLAVIAIAQSKWNLCNEASPSHLGYKIHM